MPANRGTTPNWHPTGDITGRHSLAPIKVERHKPKDKDEFIRYLAAAGLQEFDCYFGDDKDKLIKDEAERVYKDGAYSDDMIAAIYGEAPKPIQSPFTSLYETAVSLGDYPVDETEPTEVVTMLVATITHPDGSMSANATPAPVRRIA